MANFEHNSSNQGMFLAIQLDDQFDNFSRESVLKNFIKDKVSLDKFERYYKNEHRGRKIKNPQDIICAILYGYITGNHSNRKIEKLLREHIGFMFVSNRLKIDHSVLSKFKVEFNPIIRELLAELMMVLNEMGKVDWSVVVSDGTKIKAYASKGKNIGKDKTEKMLKNYRKMADKIFERDQELENSHREGQMDDQKYDEEKARIARQERIYQNTLKNIEDCVSDEKMKDRLENGQVNLTDPDSAIMPGSDKKTFIQGYNVLLTVSNNDVILDFDAIVDGERNHSEELVDRVEQLKKDLGSEEVKSKYLMDSGFEDMEKIQNLTGKGLDVYIDVKDKDFSKDTHKRKDFELLQTPEGLSLKCRNGLEAKGYLGKGDKYTFVFARSKCKGCSFFKDCYKKIGQKTEQKTVGYSRFEVENRPKIDAYLDKLKSEEGQKIYRKRIGKEHVNANIKGQRNFNQTLYRGKNRVRMDLTWMVFAHNMNRYTSFMAL